MNIVAQGGDGQLKMFGANIFVLIGLLLAAGVAVVVIVAAWTGLKIGLWRWRRQQGEAEERRRRIRPDGQPYPPASRGICGDCARVSETVYHQPDGSRLCAECYAAREM